MSDHGSGDDERPEAGKAALDRMSDAFFALDEQWRFTYLNDSAEEVIRAAVADEQPDRELVGRSIREAIPAAVDTVFQEQYERAMTTGTPVDFEAFYEPLEDWFAVKAYPSPTGLSVYFQSVTDARERDNRLEVRETVLRDVQKAIAGDRSFEGKVASLLDIGREVLGLGYGTLSRIEGDTYVFDVVSGRDDAIVSGDTVDLAATNCERTATTEETLVLADVAEEAPELTDRAGFTEMGITCYIGTPVYVDQEVYGTFCFYDTAPREEPFSNWEVTFVDLLGNLVSYGLERDLTEQKLERKNERLEEFITTVSHDLRNPLAVARGNLTLAAEEHEDQRLADAVDALDRMEAIISDLLDVARESGSVEAERVDIGELARDTWGHLGGAGQLHVLDDVTLVADAGSVERLLENLLKNAIEHGAGDPDPEASGDAGGAESLGDGPTVTIGELEDGFFVADDGPGIPADKRERVFESGYSSDQDGTGLGLHIVKRVAEAHGWSITLTESDTGGARFEFRTADTRSDEAA